MDIFVNLPRLNSDILELTRLNTLRRLTFAEINFHKISFRVELISQI